MRAVWRWVLAGALVAGPLTAAPLAGRAQTADSFGFAVMNAAITDKGRVVRSAGLASASRRETGLYRLTFTRRVDACVYSATVSGPNPGFATVTPTAKDMTLTKVDVATFDSTGMPTDLPFHFISQCAG